MIVSTLPNDYRWLTDLEVEMMDAYRIPDTIMVSQDFDQVDFACPASVPANSLLPAEYLELV